MERPSRYGQLKVVFSGAPLDQAAFIEATKAAVDQMIKDMWIHLHAEEERLYQEWRRQREAKERGDGKD